MGEPDSLGAAFLLETRTQLARHRAKVVDCVKGLPLADVWWRPNATSNSIGNLLIHLCGNARQWILSGVGGAKDVRDRPAEFAARDGASADVLCREFEATFLEVDRVLARLDPARLPEPRRIQDYDVTFLVAVLRVLNHLSTHAGQILYVTKQRTGRDLAYFDERGQPKRIAELPLDLT